MRVEIELDNSEVQAAVMTAARAAMNGEIEKQFRNHWRSDDCGPAVQLIADAVRTRIQAMELTPMIDAALVERVATVVKDRIDAMVGREVDKQLKARRGQQAAGLFPG